VVVGDLLVIDDASKRQQVERGDVLGALAVLGLCTDELGGRLISATMSLGR